MQNKITIFKKNNPVPVNLPIESKTLTPFNMKTEKSYKSMFVKPM